MNNTSKWTPELKNCECGQRAWINASWEGWVVQCCDCGNCSELQEDEKQAISNWNRHERLCAVQPVA